MHTVAGFLVLILATGIHAESMQMHRNPIRRVVTMLEEMAKSVEKEGDSEKELYDQFMCYCKKSDADLAASIDAGSQKVSELESSVQEETATKAQLDQDVTQHKADRAAAEKSVEEATAMRGKEAADFAASSGEMKANVQAMTGALAALKKGLGAALLQTSEGAVLRNIIAHTPLVSDTQRELMLSYLQGQNTEAMEGGSDQIVGIVETMKEEMESDLKESTESENAAIAAFNDLSRAKAEEIKAATKGVESKMGRSGELAVSVATNSADLEDTQESLAEDTTMKANLQKSCAQKTKEYDARRAIMAEEVTAISETIGILSSDDSLDTFKKTMPSAAAFMQTGVRSRSQMRKFTSVMNTLVANEPSHAANYKLILLQTSSKTSDFAHILKMIEDMVALLGREQADDDKQKGFCDDELSKAASEKEATEDTIKQVSAKMGELTELIETAESEIQALKDGVALLDTQVAEATDMRKKEHSDFSAAAAQNQAALELLDMAKNRMNKFYNPSMYKETTTTSAPLYGLAQEGVSFMQVRAHSRLQAQDLELGEYKKSQASGGIIQMLDQMMADVEKEMAEAKRDEDDGQKEYEETMADATAKRATDSKLLVTKDAAKAELSAKFDDAKSDKGDADTALAGLVTKIQDLHSTCDFLLENYEFRKEARTNEIGGLNEGKAVLGSSEGFLQK